MVRLMYFRAFFWISWGGRFLSSIAAGAEGGREGGRKEGGGGLRKGRREGLFIGRGRED
jgi:hypothetical protein